MTLLSPLHESHSKWNAQLSQWVESFWTTGILIWPLQGAHLQGIQPPSLSTGLWTQEWALSQLPPQPHLIYVEPVQSDVWSSSYPGCFQVSACGWNMVPKSMCVGIQFHFSFTLFVLWSSYLPSVSPFQALYWIHLPHLQGHCKDPIVHVSEIFGKTAGSDGSLTQWQILLLTVILGVCNFEI